MPILIATALLAGSASALAESVERCDDDRPPLIPGLRDVTDFGVFDDGDDIVKYIRHCKKELGFDKPNDVLPPMKCLDGTEVPITYLLPDGAGGFKERPLRTPRTGQAGLDRANGAEDLRLYKELGAGNVACARPQWLSGSCWNYAHVQKINPDPKHPEIDVVLMCRQERFVGPTSKDERRQRFEREGTEEAFKDLAYFNDIGFIMTNQRTGKTCFAFQKGSFYGGEIRWPDDDRVRTAAEARAALPGPKPPASLVESEWNRETRGAWKPPSSNGSCTGCHTGGPWMHSPWVAQAGVVPNDVRSFRDAAGVMHPVPYIPVESTSYRNQGTASITTGFVRAPNGELQAQRCTSCHRVGSKGGSCEPNLDRTTGTASPFSGRVHSNAAPGAATADEPFSAWMPLPAGGWAVNANLHADSKAKWTGEFGHHVAAIKCCCANPKAKGCGSQNLAATSLAAPVRGTEEPACAVPVAAEIRSPSLLPRTGADGTTYTIRPGRNLVLDGSLSRSADPDAKLRYVWDFGDGAGPRPESSTATASHTFTRPGTYTVTLRAIDGADTAIVTTRVVVATP